jgi:hypothetical protein
MKREITNRRALRLPGTNIRFAHPNLVCSVAALFLTCAGARAQSDSPESLARETRIPRLEFREATIREAIDFLRKKSMELLGPDRPLNINYVGRENAPPVYITCSMRETPILEVLQFVAHQTELTLGVTAHGFYLYPPGELPPETNGLREIGWSRQDMKVLGKVIYARGQKAALLETQKLIEDAFGDRFKAPREVRDVLLAITKLQDEAAKRIEESSQELREKRAEQFDDKH